MSKLKPLVLVEWVDHRFQQGEANDLRPSVMYTVGWLLGATSEVVRVATTYIPEDDTYHDVYALDRRLVRRIRRVPTSAVHHLVP